MEYEIVKSPTYDKLREEFKAYEKRFDKFIDFLLNSIVATQKFAINTRKYKHKKIGFERPVLSQYFGLDQEKIQNLSNAMKDFYEKQGLAATHAKFVPIKEEGRNEPTEFIVFSPHFSEQASFSNWLLNHANKTQRRNFESLLTAFDNFFNMYEGGFWERKDQPTGYLKFLFIARETPYWNLQYWERHTHIPPYDLQRYFGLGDTHLSFDDRGKLIKTLDMYDLPAPESLPVVKVKKRKTVKAKVK